MKNKKLAAACSVLTATAITFTTAMPGYLSAACAADGSTTSSTSTTTQTVSTTSGSSVQDTIQNIVDSMKNSENGTSKNETVYVITGADGSVQKTIVSDMIKNANNAKSISDSSTLSDIENTDGTATYTTSSGGNLSWSTDGSDITYQGTSSSSLPVTMKITYKLDGKTVSADEIAGKSGKVTIRFDYTNNSFTTETIDGEQVKVYTPFMMVSGLIMDNDTFSNIAVSNGKVIDDGDRSVVMGIAMPGMQESLGVSKDDIDIPDYVEITADATDFKLDTAVTIGTTEQFSNIDTDDLTVDSLSSDMDKLTDAMDQLLTGSSSLSSGLDTLASGASQVDSGVQTLNTGANTLASAMPTALEGTSQLEDAATQVDGGLDQMKNGTSTTTGLADALTSLGDASTSGTLINGVAQVKGGVSQVIGTNGGTAASSTGLWQARYGAIAIADGADTAVKAIGDASTTGTLENGVAQVKGGVSQVIGTNGSTTASSTGLWQAKYGAIDIASGADTAISAIGDASTTGTLLYGSTHISGGVTQVIGTNGGSAASSTGLWQARYAASGISDGMNTAINSIGDASTSGTLLNGTAATNAFLTGAQSAINNQISPALATASGTLGAQTDTTDTTAAGAINVAIGKLKGADLSTATAALTAAGTALGTDAGTLGTDATTLGTDAGALSSAATSLGTDATNLNTASVSLGTAATDLSTASSALSDAAAAKSTLDGIDTTGMTAEQIAAIQSAKDSLSSVSGGSTAAADASTQVTNATTAVGTAATDVTNAQSTASAAGSTATSAAGTASDAATQAGNAATTIGNLGTALSSSDIGGALTALQTAETKALTAKAYVDGANAGVSGLTGANDVASGASAKAAITDAIYTNGMVTTGLTALKGSATDTSGSLYAAKNAADSVVNGLYNTADPSSTAIGALTAVGLGADSITNGLTTMKGTATDTSGSLYAAKNGANAIAAGMGDTTSVKTAIGALTAVNAGNDQITAGLEQLKGTPTDTSGSLYAAKNGANAIAAGMGDTTSVQTAIGALTAVNSGNDSILSGLTILKSGGTTPSGKTSKGLEGAVEALGDSSTSGTLLYGSNAIKNGLGDLYAGITSASDGASQIASGTSQLAANTPTLASGAQTAADGSKTLESGLQQLNDEGIQKLVDAFGGDTEKMLSRVTPIIEAGKSYDNYSGISSDMSGTVKFIYRTESIGED